jgi:hypothetical protein
MLVVEEENFPEQENNSEKKATIELERGLNGLTFERNRITFARGLTTLAPASNRALNKTAAMVPVINAVLDRYETLITTS